MTRSQRLDPVKKVQQRREEQAARELQEKQDELARYRQRLADVKSYRQEYLDRFHGGDTRMSALQMRDYQVFIGKLDSAILQLEDLIRDTEIQAQSRRVDWMDQRSRFRAIEEVIDRYSAEERRDAVRRDERESDDRTQRQK